MRIIQSLVFTLAIISPVVSHAFANDESLTRRIIQDHQEAISQYAQDNNKPLPAIVNYTYGMKLDIAKVIRVSPEMRLCKVIPQLMTYENSKGELNTLQYKVMSDCMGKN
ncbi:DUF2790 domain-containing protein [Pseudomonas vanderleydeniana]|uniref:DUF2790 domain-containing protein n=1 Tax=Pseudomonas vanderleydeniana TaxID=2745495 RepID=A0A9E6PGW5_9PSED|nr:DUF2790 domain-containing protein [Pseudomonas vanderleydeniana]QXI26572.1 DUF2790 domain-containing protein [Pseudomonas vanderleydeniana]